MPAVVELPQWDDYLTANPSIRDPLLAMDTQEFIDIQKRWLNAYIPMPDAPVPGIREEELAALKLRALIFRSGKEDDTTLSSCLWNCIDSYRAPSSSTRHGVTTSGTA